MAYKKKKFPKNFRVKGNEISLAVRDILEVYSHNVTVLTKEATDKTAEEALGRVKQLAPKSSGTYADAWASKVGFENAFEKRTILYVEAPHYRLTHLLEYGHVIRNQYGGPLGKGRTAEFHHVEPTVEFAEKMYSDLIREAIKDAAE